jgi:hypothetical protein
MQVAREGFVRAIREGNLQVLFLLSCLGIENNIPDDILEMTVEEAGGNRLAVMLLVFDVLARKDPDESKWERWFEIITESARRRARNHEQKKKEQLWSEHFIASWLSSFGQEKDDTHNNLESINPTIISNFE